MMVDALRLSTLQLVIPAQAGIQQNNTPRSGQNLDLCPLRGMALPTGFPPARE
jgi:hypothetical protein